MEARLCRYWELSQYRPHGKTHSSALALSLTTPIEKRPPPNRRAGVVRVGSRPTGRRAVQTAVGSADRWQSAPSVVATGDPCLRAKRRPPTIREARPPTTMPRPSASSARDLAPSWDDTTSAPRSCPTRPSAARRAPASSRCARRPRLAHPSRAECMPPGQS